MKAGAHPYDESMTERTPHDARRGATAAIIDAVLVVVFVMIGRRSHAEGLDVAGIAGTAWPFLIALAAGWLVALAWRRPFAIWPTGVIVWAVTVAGGMLLRTTTGQGTELAFVIVATLTLAITLLGWRFVARLARPRSRAQSGEPETTTT